MTKSCSRIWEISKDDFSVDDKIEVVVPQSDSRE